MTTPFHGKAGGFPEYLKQLDNITPRPALLSFDVFDTLLERALSPPEALFPDLAREFCRELRAQFGLEVDWQFIHGGREEIEARMRAQNPRQFGVPEYLFRELATEQAARLEEKFPDGPDKETYVRLMMESEIRGEIRALRPMPGVTPFLTALRERGFPLVAVSDIYLGREILGPILEAHGLKSFFQDIFVSADYMAGKAQDRRTMQHNLFRHVSEKTGVKYENILHFGDNPGADYRSPREIGMGCIHFEQPEKLKRFRKNRFYLKEIERGNTGLSGPLLLNQIIRSPSLSNPWYRFGFGSLGPVFSVFTLGLLRKVRHGPFKKLYFLSRDGYLLKKLYDITTRYSPPEADLPESRYLYLSRASVAPAALAGGMTLQVARVILEMPGNDSFQNLWSAFGLPDSGAVMKVPRRLGIAANMEQGVLSNPNLFKELLGQPDFQKAIKEFARPRARLLLSYLKQEGFRGGEESALVDMGWNGTIQKLLSFVPDPEEEKSACVFPNITGFYFGFWGNETREGTTRGNRYHGIINDGRLEDFRETGAKYFLSLFEWCAQAPEQTVLGYTLHRGVPVPVFKKDSPAHTGGDSDFPDEPRRHRDRQYSGPAGNSSRLRAGILRYALQTIPVLERGNFSFKALRPWARQWTEDITLRPPPETARLLMSFEQPLDFGKPGSLRFPDYRVPGFLRVVARPIRFVILLRQSPWKEGTLASAGLGFLSPLLRLVRVLHWKQQKRRRSGRKNEITKNQA